MQIRDCVRTAACCAWHDLEHHFGLMVGYPIGSTDTPATALAGVSYRYAPYGLQVGLGLQLYERISLVGATQDPTSPTDESALRVDLRTPGNALLTLEDVTTSEVFPAAFFLVGLSTDFLSTL